MFCNRRSCDRYGLKIDDKGGCADCWVEKKVCRCETYALAPWKNCPIHDYYNRLETIQPECIMQVDEHEWACIVMMGEWPEKLDIQIEYKEFNGYVIEEEILTCLICGECEIQYPC